MSEAAKPEVKETGKPEVKETPKAAPTAEELEASRKEFAEITFGNRPKPKKEAKVEPKEEVKETPKEAPKAEVKPEIKPKAKAKPVIDEDRLADKVADRLRPVPVEEPGPKAQPGMKSEPVSTDGMDLSEKDQEILEGLRQIEASNPKRKGVVDATVRFWKQEAEYKEKWLKDNPGEKFDPADKEHEGFYSGHQPDVSEEEIDRGIEMVKEARITAKATAQANAKVEQMEVRQRFKDEGPKIEQQAHESIEEFLVEASPELAEAAKVDGKISLTPEVINKIKESDPDVFEILDHQAEVLRVEVRELERLARFPGAYLIDLNREYKLQDGRIIRPHAELVDFVTNLESELVQAPKEETEKDGRTFIPQAEFHKRTQEVFQSKKSAGEKKKALEKIDGQFWTLDTEAIRKALTTDIAEKTKARIKKLNEIVERRLTRKNGSASNHAPVKPETNGANNHEEAAYTPPPRTVSASDRTNTQKSGSARGGIKPEVFDSKLFPQ